MKESCRKSVVRWAVLLTAACLPLAASASSLKRIDDSQIATLTSSARIVVLNFWATWCPPCRGEIPGFVRLQQRYGHAGLQIVGVSVDDPAAVAQFWQTMKINYPLLLADDSVYDLMATYGNREAGLPYSVVIRPDGGTAATRLGAYGEKELESLLVPLLPQNHTPKN